VQLHATAASKGAENLPEHVQKVYSISEGGDSSDGESGSELLMDLDVLEEVEHVAFADLYREASFNLDLEYA
jgi:hypothetical protein